MEGRGLDGVRVGSAVVGSLVPWAAFLLAGALADEGAVHLLPAVPFYLLFVAVPSMIAIVAGRTALARLAVGAAMTAVAGYAGVQVATIDDGQAGLAVLWVHVVAVPLAAVVWLGGAAAGRRKEARSPGPARPSDRLAALTVDAVLVGIVLAAPVTLLSNAKAEVVAVVAGVLLATLYFAAFAALPGRTPGQALLCLRLVDHASGEAVTPGRALLRSLVLVLELLGAAWMLLAPVALAELWSVVASGRSLTDRLFGTSVVAD